MRRLLCLVFAGAIATLAARAADAPAAIHPALWHVKGARGELYLFGSVHLLWPGLDWQQGAVAEAIGRADVFVFEIPLDDTTFARLRSLVATQGMLAKDESLHAMLPPTARSDLDADAALAGVKPEDLDHMRPWLAGLVLVTSRMAEENASSEYGADAVLSRQAQSQHRELRYLESLDRQIALIIPPDRKTELSEFEASLKEFHNEKDAFPALLKAWLAGDTGALDNLVNGELKDDPDARTTLLDDRNRAWLPELEAMLNERKTFFVTVGMGHLVGTNSVPALLRADGYTVDGP